MAVEAMFKMLGWWYLRDDLGCFLPWKQTNFIRTSFEVTHFRKGVKNYPNEFFLATQIPWSPKKTSPKDPNFADSIHMAPMPMWRWRTWMVFPNWGGMRVCRWWKRTLQGTDRYPLLGKGKSSTQMCLFLGWICLVSGRVRWFKMMQSKHGFMID